jgi:response regulator RpfG family c-di-GMP phosphodiesterase
MGIPDSILLKASSLIKDEWKIMKQHPSYTKSFLSTADFLKPALDIPYFHHEKWDGSGYPNNLSGEEIPLAARIFSIADVGDAMSSNCHYRGPINRDEIIQTIKKGSGSHFDPNVVSAFLDMMEEHEPESGVFPGVEMRSQPPAL